MSRSSKMRGPVPKSRAKLRGRLDRAEPETEPERVRLSEWIAGWLPADRRELASLDLRAYLSETARFEIDAGERLRLLAVHLDEQGLVWWEVFSRIYEAAKRLSPRDPIVLQSEAITALNLALGLDCGDAVWKRLVAVAKRASVRAVELDENDADLHYTYGSALYTDDDTEGALESFDTALAHAPEHPWARLYRAHCLHDLERWSEAADAYARVDHAVFVGPRAWRMELLREQRAYCLLQAGQREEGLALVQEVVRRREQALARGENWYTAPALQEPPLLLAEAARLGWLPDELRARLKATLTANDERWVSLAPQ
jgi:tetratricopeptide (TPR) repeat protein